MRLHRKEANRRYAPQMFGLVGIAGGLTPLLNVGNSAFTANNQIRGIRGIVPFDGVLHDLYVWVGNSSGNVRGLVYDTGDALRGSRTKLWDGGSIACPASGDWKSLGDPAINVYAGQHLDLALQADNTTATFGRINAPTTAVGILPAAFLPCRGGASPKMIFAITQGSFTAAAAIAEASINGSTNLGLLLYARVTPA